MKGRIFHRLKKITGLLSVILKKSKKVEASTNYQIINNHDLPVLDGWKSGNVVKRQHEAFEPLLIKLRQGEPRQDFIAAAQAIEYTGLINPYLLDIGCGSGYYSEVLGYLNGPISYAGMDYAEKMIEFARKIYPNNLFFVGNGCDLPLPPHCFDIVFLGTSLMHIPNYKRAIAESIRVTRCWCIYHTVPVVKNSPTIYLKKMAYGKPVIELIFNQSEIERSFSTNGLLLIEKFDSIAYDISAHIGEQPSTVTYLCKKQSCWNSPLQ